LNDHLTPSKANNVRTPIDHALSVLMPWSSDPCGNTEKPSFPGLHEFVRQLTGGRTTVRAVQLWSSGRRNAPAWFVAILRDRLLAQRNAVDEALQDLAEYRGGRGQGAGLRDWWRAEKYRRAVAARVADQAVMWRVIDSGRSAAAIAVGCQRRPGIDPPCGFPDANGWSCCGGAANVADVPKRQTQP
jgi:hypothetical protein